MVNYLKYLKNNPKKYWFKRKLYGWGWIPATWQGWIVTLIFVILIVLAAKFFLLNNRVIEYLVALIVSMILLIIIASKKGEKPRWSWGE